jgi:hypothetical protein
MGKYYASILFFPHPSQYKHGGGPTRKYWSLIRCWFGVKKGGGEKSHLHMPPTYDGIKAQRNENTTHHISAFKREGHQLTTLPHSFFKRLA